MQGAADGAGDRKQSGGEHGEHDAEHQSAGYSYRRACVGAICDALRAGR